MRFISVFYNVLWLVFTSEIFEMLFAVLLVFSSIFLIYYFFKRQH